jgi:hypothetical protein
MMITVRSYRNPFRYGSDRRRFFSGHLRSAETVATFIRRCTEAGHDRGAVTFYLRYASGRGYIELTSHGVPVRATVAPAPVRPYAPAPVAEYSGSTDPNNFGVEFECLPPAGMSRAALAARITAAGVDCHEEGYNHFVRPTWKVVTDGSIGYDGAEVVSPILNGEEGFRQVAKVCETLTAAGCQIKKSCGFHVHVNARGQGLDFFRRLVALYATNEDLLDSVQPASRRANVYCATVKNFSPVSTAQSADELCSRMVPDRYRKLNLESYRRHRTVEFRQHSGTVDAGKALAWVRLCLAMCAFARGTETVPAAADLATFLGAMNVSEDDRFYFEIRRARFAVAAPQRRAA